MKDSALKRGLLKVYDRVYMLGMQCKDEVSRVIYGTPKVMSIDQTIDYILREHCSVVRYGDGEFKLVNGQPIRFQKFDPKLSTRLGEILWSDENDVLVCIPDIYRDLKWMIPSAYQYMWMIVAQNRKAWTKIVSKKKDYGNAFISRCYLEWQDKSKCACWFQKLKQIWQDKDIVFIEGEKSRLGYGNDLFDNAASIQRILCPVSNAFEAYDAILTEAQKLPKDKLILLALGPTATVLAYDLAKLGYWAIDIGHVDIEYEWFLRKATEKIKIENKYTNEAVGGDKVSEITDAAFEKQVITIVKSE